MFYLTNGENVSNFMCRLAEEGRLNFLDDIAAFKIGSHEKSTSGRLQQKKHVKEISSTLSRRLIHKIRVLQNINKFYIHTLSHFTPFDNMSLTKFHKRSSSFKVIVWWRSFSSRWQRTRLSLFGMVRANGINRIFSVDGMTPTCLQPDLKKQKMQERWKNSLWNETIM